MSGSPIYEVLRRALFHVDPERSHELAAASLAGASRSRLGLAALRSACACSDDTLSVEVCGIRFPNPVGLAAGFDKNGRLIHGMAALGFGFVEVGTVTPRPQAGNPKPRMFRLKGEGSLQNALGFNNEGMERVRDRLKANAPYPVPVGVNLGKNKDTPDEDAADDYAAVLETMAEAGDYFVVNISSPNTPGLRALQHVDFVQPLMRRLKALTDRPIFLKLSPDESTDTCSELGTAAVESGAAGIIATNTTVDYSLSAEAGPAGGISGRLLAEKSRGVLKTLVEALPADTPVVSVGGIDSGAEAIARLEGGARLVQLYTGLVYEGPGLPGRINRDLARCLRERGLRSPSELAAGG